MNQMQHLWFTILMTLVVAWFSSSILNHILSSNSSLRCVGTKLDEFHPSFFEGYWSHTRNTLIPSIPTHNHSDISNSYVTTTVLVILNFRPEKTSQQYFRNEYFVFYRMRYLLGVFNEMNSKLEKLKWVQLFRQHAITCVRRRHSSITKDNRWTPEYESIWKKLKMQDIRSGANQCSGFLRFY